MSYFSNHSTAPRFLANSQPGSTTTTATTTATSANHTLPRRMSSTSKHFSTTLAPGAIERSKSKESLNGTGTVHPLRNTYVRHFLFYAFSRDTYHSLPRWVVFFHHRPPGGKVTNYEEGINKISSFSSVRAGFFFLDCFLFTDLFNVRSNHFGRCGRILPPPLLSVRPQITYSFTLASSVQYGKTL